jgi:hypothetical protein
MRWSAIQGQLLNSVFHFPVDLLQSPGANSCWQSRYATSRKKGVMILLIPKVRQREFTIAVVAPSQNRGMLQEEAACIAKAATYSAPAGNVTNPGVRRPIRKAQASII